MYAITLNGFGDPEVMQWTQVADLPAPGPGEVTIDVVAAGVNRADVMQRLGLYPPPPGVSEIPGLEVSGHIAEVGRRYGHRRRCRTQRAIGPDDHRHGDKAAPEAEQHGGQPGENPDQHEHQHENSSSDAVSADNRMTAQYIRLSAVS